MVKEVRLVLENASAPIVASVLVPEKTTEARLMALPKAESPIVVTLAGIVMEVICADWNA